MIHNAVGDADDGDHPVLPEQCFSLHLGCEPRWLRNKHQLFTGFGQSNWPAAPISANPHFLDPTFGKNCLQVSGQCGLIQVLKARNFRAALWQIVLSKANCAAPIPNGWSLWSQMTVTAFDSRRVRVKMNSGMSSPHDNARLDF